MRASTCTSTRGSAATTRWQPGPQPRTGRVSSTHLALGRGGRTPPWELPCIARTNSTRIAHCAAHSHPQSAFSRSETSSRWRLRTTACTSACLGDCVGVEPTPPVASVAKAWWRKGRRATHPCCRPTDTYVRLFLGMMLDSSVAHAPPLFSRQAATSWREQEQGAKLEREQSARLQIPPMDAFDWWPRSPPPIQCGSVPGEIQCAVSRATRSVGFNGSSGGRGGSSRRATGSVGINGSTGGRGGSSRCLCPVAHPHCSRRDRMCYEYPFRRGNVSMHCVNRIPNSGSAKGRCVDPNVSPSHFQAQIRKWETS